MAVFKIPDLTITTALALNDELKSIVIDKEVVFDFSHMSNFDPFAMLVSGSIIRNFREKHPEIPFRIDGHLDKSYAGTMGYFKYISPKIKFGKMPGEAFGSQNYIPITEIDIDQLMSESARSGEYQLMGELVESESNKLSKIISRDSIELHKLLTYLLRELIRNTPEHSETNSVWVCGQHWPRYQIAEIAVLDEGIGVYNSIIKNKHHREYISNNQEALKWAIKPGVSQVLKPSRKQKSSDPWSNSGYGLYMTSQITERLNGEFCIASSDSYLRLDSNGRIEGNTSIQGTAIRLRVPTHYIRSSKEIIDAIAIQGEIEARTIRNAFKKASLPSKGLMD